MHKKFSAINLSRKLLILGLILQFSGSASAHIGSLFPMPGNTSGGYVGISISDSETGIENMNLDCGSLEIKGDLVERGIYFKDQILKMEIYRKGESNPFYKTSYVMAEAVAARFGRTLNGIAFTDISSDGKYNLQLKAKYDYSNQTVAFYLDFSSKQPSGSKPDGGVYQCSEVSSMRSRILPFSQFADRIEREQKRINEAWIRPSGSNPWEGKSF